VRVGLPDVHDPSGNDQLVGRGQQPVDDREIGAW